MNPAAKIGLGTVQFGLPYGISNKHGQTAYTEVEEILKYAKSSGVCTLDTASVYGSSEHILGRNDLEGFNIVSKFIIKQDGQTLSQQLKRSIYLLKVSSLYGYMAHRPFDVVNDLTLWNDLLAFKNQGLIRKIGFSFNEVEEIDAILAKNIIPDIVQVPFNYLDNRFEKYLVFLKEKGCEIHTRSAFLQGLFFSNSKMLSSFFNDVKPIIQQLQIYGNTLPGMLLKYCTDKPFIDKVIFGVNTLSQLKKNIENITVTNSLPLNTRKVDESILIPSKWPK